MGTGLYDLYSYGLCKPKTWKQMDSYDRKEYWKVRRFRPIARLEEELLALGKIKEVCIV